MDDFSIRNLESRIGNLSGVAGAGRVSIWGIWIPDSRFRFPMGRFLDLGISNLASGISLGLRPQAALGLSPTYGTGSD